MEEAVVSAVTDDTSEAKITVGGVPDRPGVAARLFRQLADRGINIDMIVQNTSAKGITDISFTVAKTDLDAATEACETVQGRDRRDRGHERRQHRTRVDHRRRHEVEPRGDRADVRDALGERHQHRDDLDEFDSDLVRDARRKGGRRRAPPPHARSGSTPRRGKSRPVDFRHASRRRRSHRPSGHRRCARYFASAPFPVEEIRFFASSRSAGSTLEWNGEPIEVEDAATADFSGSTSR